MVNIKLTSQALSNAVWTHLYKLYSRTPLDRLTDFNERSASLDKLRSAAAFNTGSISASAAWGLYAIANSFKPISVIEIGTFIGRSTTALAYGMADAETNGTIYTCDSKNTLNLPKVEGCTIKQFKGTTSTEMLTSLLKLNNPPKVDLIYIDGLLQDPDIELLRNICQPHVAIVLDDFEGIEKGTVNAVALKKARIPINGRFVGPPSDDILKRFGFFDGSTTALLIDPSVITFQ